MNRKWLLILVPLVIAIVGAGVYMMGQNVTTQNCTTSSHTNPLDPTSGCADCHNEPISVVCTYCHSEPPTDIDGISFPHHNPSSGGPPDNCHLDDCHGGKKNDARYAKTPNASHKYCHACHQRRHSTP